MITIFERIHLSISALDQNQTMETSSSFECLGLFIGFVYHQSHIDHLTQTNGISPLLEYLLGHTEPVYLSVRCQSMVNLTDLPYVEKSAATAV
jgi:hypothetical protein